MNRKRIKKSVCTMKALEQSQPIHIYIKRLGMFPFKVQLFQGCESETEPKTQNLLCNMLYDTKYCWWHITKSIPSTVAAVQKEDSFLYV
jgi:hypothetical protein